MRACAQGVADYVKRAGVNDGGLIIGYDTRFASEDFGSAAAEVIAGNGTKVYLCPRATPTPVVKPPTGICQIYIGKLIGYSINSDKNQKRNVEFDFGAFIYEYDGALEIIGNIYEHDINKL